MNDSQLRCFHVAAAEASITKAAARLGISQPAVSSQIKMLEKGYGVQLFRRVGRRIELTEFGAHLKAITERLYAARAEAEELLVGNRSLRQGHLRIGAVSPYYALSILEQFRTTYPDVTFSMTGGNSASVYEALCRYDIDIGVLAGMKLGDTRHHIQLLRRDDVVLLVGRAHPLAHRGIVTLSELAHETIIIREQGSTTRSIFLSAMMAADAGMPRLLVIETREATKEAVARGFGVAPVLRFGAGADDRCAMVRIVPTPPSFEEFVACPRDVAGNPLIRSFLEAADVVAGQHEKLRQRRAAS